MRVMSDRFLRVTVTIPSCVVSTIAERGTATTFSRTVASAKTESAPKLLRQLLSLRGSHSNLFYISQIKILFI